MDIADQGRRPAPGPTIVIEPDFGWHPIDFRAIWEYRDLLYLLIRRDIKGVYAQSVLGFGWALARPLFSMIIFTVIFGNLAKISSDGVPYPIFSYTALVPWLYFSASLTNASSSLLSASPLISKVYFPRAIVPLTPVFAKLVDFAIAMVFLFILMAWFRIVPTIWVLALPFLVLLMMLTAAGLGMWLTALTVQYRDLRHALTFGIQLFMYISPVVYPASLIPAQYRWFYGINPMAGVIEGFRSALLGTQAMPWDFLIVGSVSATTLALTGALFFRYRERVFADVI